MYRVESDGLYIGKVKQVKRGGLSDEALERMAERLNRKGIGIEKTKEKNTSNRPK